MLLDPFQPHSVTDVVFTLSHALTSLSLRPNINKVMWLTLRRLCLSSKRNQVSLFRPDCFIKFYLKCSVIFVQNNNLYNPHPPPCLFFNLCISCTWSFPLINHFCWGFNDPPWYPLWMLWLFRHGKFTGWYWAPIELLVKEWIQRARQVEQSVHHRVLEPSPAPLSESGHASKRSHVPDHRQAGIALNPAGQDATQL